MLECRRRQPKEKHVVEEGKMPEAGVEGLQRLKERS
jgi:hypothetical protein